MPLAWSAWAREALAVARKDVLAELRSRVALAALGLFALTTLFIVSFAIGPFALDPDEKPFLYTALLWIILFFAAMSGLARGFVHEEESGTAAALRLAAAPSVVLAGKLLFNFGLLCALNIAVVPLFVVLMAFPIASPLAFTAVLAAGSLGLAVTSTFIGAIISKSGAKGTLFAVLSFPLLAPLLVAAIRGMQAAAETGGGAETAPYLRFLLAYTGAMLSAAAMLFAYVWQE